MGLLRALYVYRKNIHQNPFDMALFFNIYSIYMYAVFIHLEKS